MIDLLDFSIDNAICKLTNNIIRQTVGIPQGDSLSPAACIGTCAWFENKWMNNMPTSTKDNISISRYLDDVFMMANTNMIGYENIIEAFKQECYPTALTLEGEDGETNFLETTIINTKTDIQCKHRNKNAGLSTQEFYRGKHAFSYHDDRHKMGALIGLFQRMRRNTSHHKFMSDCIQEKVQELQQLQYSDKKIRAALITVRNKHREDETEFDMWHDCISLLFGTKTRAYYE